MKDAHLAKPYDLVHDWTPWRCPSCQAPMGPLDGWLSSVRRPVITSRDTRGLHGVPNARGPERFAAVRTCASHYCRSKAPLLPEVE